MHNLKKHLGPLDVFSIAAGAMISSGLFVLPGLTYAEIGPGSIVAYGIAAILVIPVMFAKIELSTAMPRAGGNYFFIERTFGSLAGVFAGFSDWFAVGLKSAFALVGLGAMAATFLPNIPFIFSITVLGAGALFTVVNLVSTKGSGKLQTVLVAGLLVILVLFVATGISNVETSRYDGMLDVPYFDLFAVAGMIFVSYGGLTKVAAVSEEVKNPSRNIPLGVFGSFAVVSTLYILVVGVVVGVVPGNELSGNLSPIATAASVSMGQWGLIILSVAAFLAFATTANAGLMSASRAPLAMARDGLVSRRLIATNKRFGTPHASILVTGIGIATVAAFVPVKELVKTASTMMILMFILVLGAVVVLRFSKINNYRPTFRMPFTPWLNIVTMVVYAGLIVDMGLIPLLSAAAFGILAFSHYMLYVRKRGARQSALNVLVRRIISTEMDRPELEDELLEITLQREGIVADAFDELVRKSLIIDVQEHVHLAECFRMICSRMSVRVGLPPNRLFEAFVEREQESSTVIAPGLAIPHIVVDEEGVFELAVVRSTKGVITSDGEPPVNAVFALIGSRNARKEHLQALMSIAQIVQQKGHIEAWLKAPSDIEALRDLLLLSKRSRATGVEKPVTEPKATTA